MKLESNEDKTKLFKVLEAHMTNIASDMFGNYVIRKLMDDGPEVQRDAVCRFAAGNMETLAGNAYGCRILQAAMSMGSESVQVGC